MAEVVASENGEDFSSGVLRRGSLLGRYELVVPVAVGGMARVWAARMHGHHGFTKLVAIKTILPHLARDPDFERMFLDEARIASLVHHPNVCEIYELGDERGVLYLAMEWVNGDSLAHVLRSETAKASTPVEPIDPRVAARIVADACAGLHAAHNLTDEQGLGLDVVHRDVSPHNILVSADGNVKVADFGVAKAFGEGRAATAAGQLKGRIAYMAPEQATGGFVDRRSDLFSLGCVLYEATTGKQPFQGGNEHRIMTELLKGQFTPPSRVVRGYPFELERIVLRAMSASPLQRFPSMDRMRLALEEWLAKSGPVVTQSNVAEVVRVRAGAMIDARKERIRAASGSMTDRGEREITEKELAEPVHTSPPRARMSSHSTSGVVPAGEVPSEQIRSMPPPDEPRPLPTMDLASRPHTSGVQYAMAASIGVIAAAIVVAAGIYVWHALDAPESAAKVAIAETIDAAATTLAAPSSSAAIAPTEAPRVAFKVVPKQAFLIVDGAALATDVRSIARPPAGKSETVIVRADGFDDETLKIDETAPASVDVWLTPKKSAGKGRDPKGNERQGQAGPAPSSGPAGAKKGAEALPANPY